MRYVFKSFSIMPLAAILCLVFSLSAGAQYDASQKPSHLQIGTTVYYFDYKEDLNAPLKSEERGWLPGVYLDYTFKKPSTIYVRAFFSYAANDITYDGSTWGGDPVKFNDQKARMFKGEANLGYTIPLGRKFSLIPYFGYGFQYWERGDNEYIASYNVVTYKETYKWHYIPVGIKADLAVSNNFSIAASASANFMVYGDMKAELSYVSLAYSDTKFILGNRVGAYAEIPMTYKFTNELGVVLTPWYEYRAFGKSDWEYIGDGWYAQEPSSKAHKYGVRIGLLMNF